MPMTNGWADVSARRLLSLSADPSALTRLTMAFKKLSDLIEYLSDDSLKRSACRRQMVEEEMAMPFLPPEFQSRNKSLAVERDGACFCAAILILMHSSSCAVDEQLRTA